MTIKGILQMSIAIVKAFSTRNFVPSKLAENVRFVGENEVEM